MNPQDRMSAYPPSTVASPHLFKKIAVPGICGMNFVTCENKRNRRGSTT